MMMFGWTEGKAVTVTSGNKKFSKKYIFKYLAAQGLVGILTLFTYIVFIVFRMER